MNICSYCGHREFDHDIFGTQMTCPLPGAIVLPYGTWKTYGSPMEKRAAELLAGRLAIHASSVKVSKTSSGKFQIFTLRSPLTK